MARHNPKLPHTKCSFIIESDLLQGLRFYSVATGTDMSDLVEEALQRFIPVDAISEGARFREKFGAIQEKPDEYVTKTEFTDSAVWECMAEKKITQERLAELINALPINMSKPMTAANKGMVNAWKQAGIPKKWRDAVDAALQPYGFTGYTKEQAPTLYAHFNRGSE